MSKLTKQEKQHIIKEVDATMKMEGMPLTTEDKQLLNDISNGKITRQTAIKKIIQEYKE